MSRIKNSIKNLVTAIAGQFVGIVVSFLSRMIFVRILGSEYLGINGLFTNVLTVLTLVELGIGPAIVYSLYKPLAEKNIPKVQALMELYQRVYVAVGAVVFVLGIFTTPFLHIFIKDMPNVPDIQFIFLLFVLNTSISYFFSYKRSLIIADQHRYIATLYRYGFYALLNIFQIIFLYVSGNYIIFLTLQIMSTLLENIAVSLHANRLYPFLKEKTKSVLDKETKQEIIKNTIAMIMHKIGGIVVTATDNILISRISGLVAVGLYSNYQLIINALQTVLSQIFVSIVASVGNLGAVATKEKTESVFNIIFFMNFWLFGFCTIAFSQLVNPFIEVWLGKDLLLSVTVVLIISANLYLTGMRRAVLTFRDALGLYWYDRYKPIAEAVINLTASITLGMKWGIPGVLSGTIISTIATCFWIEPWMLYKYGFSTSVKRYFITYGRYSISTIVALALTAFFCGQTPLGGGLSLLLKAMICIVIPNAIWVLFYYRTDEYKYLTHLLLRIVLRRNLTKVSR